MFDLKSPCVNCPFRKGCGSRFRLNRHRLAGIIGAQAFQCHKTVDYDGEDEDEDGFVIPEAGDSPQQCAGLMAILHRDGVPNQIMQMAERLKFLDPTKLDPRREAYDSRAQAIRAHTTGREPKQRKK